ncbi:MAG: hypothetical protein EBR02_08795 [Alphaproteobacteria bacterium]|nr:hypothetical protein [Alphaproteobacteria bacterium]
MARDRPLDTFSELTQTDYTHASLEPAPCRLWIQAIGVKEGVSFSVDCHARTVTEALRDSTVREAVETNIQALCHHFRRRVEPENRRNLTPADVQISVYQKPPRGAEFALPPSGAKKTTVQAIEIAEPVTCDKLLGSLKFQVKNLCDYIKTSQLFRPVFPEFLEIINKLLAPKEPFTEENLSEDSLLTEISIKYLRSKDPMQDFLNDVQAEMTNDNPLAEYKRKSLISDKAFAAPENPLGRVEAAAARTTAEKEKLAKRVAESKAEESRKDKPARAR